MHKKTKPYIQRMYQNTSRSAIEILHIPACMETSGCENFNLRSVIRDIETHPCVKMSDRFVL
ncbi:UNVERIFIED_CONTAM: hypothetical protein FKN15_076773 [Acipenser sinensis]